MFITKVIFANVNRNIFYEIFLIINFYHFRACPELVCQNYKKDKCFCESCSCRNLDKKHREPKKATPKNAVVFQLPKYREQKSDTYSHSVYRKDMCNRYLIKQHAALAQKKATHRPKKPPIVEKERFTYKTIAKTDYHWYNSKELAASKAKYARTKRKDDSYLNPGDFRTTAKFLSLSVSHDNYSAKDRIPSTYKKDTRNIAYFPFERFSCYNMDYKLPSRDAYCQNRRPRKRVLFD